MTEEVRQEVAVLTEAFIEHDFMAKKSKPFKTTLKVEAIEMPGPFKLGEQGAVHAKGDFVVMVSNGSVVAASREEFLTNYKPTRRYATASPPLSEDPA